MTTQSTQYDKIGGDYSLIKQLPSDLLDTATLLAYLGNIQGMEVLDLACGNGFMSGKAIEHGARRVVGIDISSSMIQAASRQFEGDSRFEFYTADCSKPIHMGKFDIVFACWLLNYASSAEEQLAMWQNIFAHLKPGGRCIGVVPNFDMLETPFPSGYQWGIEAKVLKHVPGGVKLQFTADNCSHFTFECYMLQRAVYESCSRKAGFTDMEWLDPIDPKDPRINFEALSRTMNSRYFQAWR
ncbi:S-adenosyl-L-methionine-dependent methyltransferase [Penicillium soppii]|jgi:SAM-dependent methyltransferase|uniref:S-adenosyl-L-methionine-dependent methyltransferase n=1 Tax=Penicillium soppii TaxID=69789 RepID=UPI0025489237|nr:S-adenosyl-L-methionine-dependent methyltransferase [Penicillium soppii]KAJ5876030.1 S-adenosyl-L-methionine-dependent methyltransferase [Penicillium soppii]